MHSPQRIHRIWEADFSTSVNYVKTFAQKHHLDVLAAYEVESYQTDKASGERSKLPSYVGLTEPDNGSSVEQLRFINAGLSYAVVYFTFELRLPTI